jgi:hypothetical protein
MKDPSRAHSPRPNRNINIILTTTYGMLNLMTRYAKRKLKYSLNENFNLLSYVEWDRFVTLTGAQAE